MKKNQWKIILGVALGAVLVTASPSHATDFLWETETAETKEYQDIPMQGGIVKASLLKVDGEPVGYFNQEEAEKDLEELVKPYLSSEDQKIRFTKDIEWEESYILESQLNSMEAFDNYLQEKEAVTEYTTFEEEKLDDILDRFHMTQKEFDELNEGWEDLVREEAVEGDGEEETTYIVEPKQTFQVTGKQANWVFEVVRQGTEEVDISYETEEVLDDAMYQGERALEREGVNGRKKVFFEESSTNGGDLEKKTLREEVLTEPVNEIVRVGTKEKPKGYFSGNFIKPTRGYVSSDYGWRWGSFHTGVDFANSTGTPIWASEGGTVSFAGWSRGYGYNVRIRHGNGYETRYAHLSRILCSEGQVVDQGEVIGKMGSTGWSTGPHLHFEIRLNGNHKNPWNYL